MTSQNQALISGLNQNDKQTLPLSPNTLIFRQKTLEKEYFAKMFTELRKSGYSKYVMAPTKEFMKYLKTFWVILSIEVIGLIFNDSINNFCFKPNDHPEALLFICVFTLIFICI